MARLFLVLLVRKLYLSCVLSPHLELEGDTKNAILNLELAPSKITFFLPVPIIRTYKWSVLSQTVLSPPLFSLGARLNVLLTQICHQVV